MSNALATAAPRRTGGLNLTGLSALFWLTIQQFVRGKRLLVLSFLFLIPSVIAVLVQTLNRYPPRPDNLEIGLILHLLPHALVPLAALLYASSMIQDEI